MRTAKGTDFFCAAGKLVTLNEGLNVHRRRQFCTRCGQLMFEYFRSPDGHFGMVDPPQRSQAARSTDEVRCPTCGAQYRLLERLNAAGQPVERK